VHIGKVNRVKCQVRMNATQRPVSAAEFEPLYVIPTQATLVLARPDEHKPFWAVPVVVEPLRLVRLELGDENHQIPLQGVNNDEPQWSLRIEITTPSSACLKKPVLQGVHGGGMASAASRPFALGPKGGVMGYGTDDRLATTMVPLGGHPANQPLDRIAHSQPVPIANISLWGGNGGAVEEQHVATTAPCVLLFADERRRKVVCKILAQAQHAVHNRMSEGIEAFFVRIRDGSAT